MTANYVLLEKITVGAAGAASVTFSGIPQTGYTDLVVKVSGRNTNVVDCTRWLGLVQFNNATRELLAIYRCTGTAGKQRYGNCQTFS
jgi:hypothetical protein